MDPAWLAVWTRSRHEKLVHEQLLGKDLDAFLPMLHLGSRRRDRRAMIDVPAFPGYLFVHVDPADAGLVYDVKATRGVVRILGPSGTRYSMIPDDQIEAVRTMVTSTLRVDPFPYLKVGKRVRVKCGPLKGVEGILIEKRRGLRVVVSVELMCQSIAAEVSAEELEAA